MDNLVGDILEEDNWIEEDNLEEDNLEGMPAEVDNQDEEHIQIEEYKQEVENKQEQEEYSDIELLHEVNHELYHL